MRLGQSCLTFCRCLTMLAISAALAAGTLTSAQQDQLPLAPPLPAERIVAEMQLHNRMRRQHLLHYVSTRRYAVKYQGFLRSLTAAMEVQASFQGENGESLQIVGQSGSKFLRDEVLKRAVVSEADASQHPLATELSPRNYTFKMLGTEGVSGRPAYVLQVHARYPGKYLYDGKIWVDAADFALARIEAVPARSPSFWIRHTEIHEEFAPVGGFWLPRSNRSETKVRFGGTAAFTIDYGTYRIVASDVPTSQSTK